MSDESNLPFQTDIINWSKLTQRMYIWGKSYHIMR